MKRLQMGLTLVELMVATAVGLILIGGVTTVYLATLRSSADTLKMGKLNQELSTLMAVMENDIRRAGYASGLSPTSPTSNPFTQVGTTALTVLTNMTGAAVTGNSSTGGSCILYAYDANSNGTVDNTDIFGFRLSGTVVEMRQQSNGSNNNSCNDANHTWLPVTDGSVVSVTSLTFTLDASECLNTREPNDLDDDADGTVDNEGDCFADAPTAGSGDITVTTRQVGIRLEGQLVDDANVRLELDQDVRVRNDWVQVW